MINFNFSYPEKIQWLISQRQFCCARSPCITVEMHYFWHRAETKLKIWNWCLSYLQKKKKFPCWKNWNQHLSRYVLLRLLVFVKNYSCLQHSEMKSRSFILGTLCTHCTALCEVMSHTVLLYVMALPIEHKKSRRITWKIEASQCTHWFCLPCSQCTSFSYITAVWRGIRYFDMLCNITQSVAWALTKSL